MIINRLEMYNFRQYIGSQSIDFSTDQEKNVTVLIGTNTSGKTTIIRAFEWCLYGKSNFEDQILLNSDVRVNMHTGETQTVSVSIIFTHNGITYTLKRLLKYTCSERKLNDDGSVEVILSKNPSLTLTLHYLQNDGQTKTAVDSLKIKELIDQIIPSDLSDYFFFGGERISNIANRTDLTKAVKGLMGLDILENARNHLKKVIKSFESNIDPSGDENALKAKDALETFQQKLKFTEEKKQNADEQMDYWRDKENECNIALANSDIEQVKKAKAKRDTIISEIKKHEAELRVAIRNMVEAFNKKPYAFFGMPAIKKSLEILESVKESTESIPYTEQAAIDYLLNRGCCICGTQLRPDTLAYQKVMNERKKLPPENIGSAVRSYRQETDKYLATSEDYLETLKDKLKYISVIETNLGNLQDDYQRASEAILNEAEVSKLERDRENAHIKYIEAKNDSEEANQEIGKYKGNIDNCQRTLANYAKSSKKNERIAKLLMYSQNVYNWLDGYYKNEENKVREELEKLVNDNFSHMYHGERSIYIDEKYHVRYSDIKTDESEGLKAVRSFAFIASLVSMARKRAKNKLLGNPAMTLSQVYPIVMDAPFSNVDEIHIENICKILPKTANQVIMAVMQKDWDYAAKNLDNYVGRRYLIEKALDDKHREIETITHIRLLEG